MTNIVMLARDRYALTKQALESLYAHTNDIDFNLVVVDDGSADTRVSRLLRQWSEQQNCSILTVANSGHTLSQLKNIGVAWSEQRFGRGDWLHVGDSDVYFMPDWMEKLTELADASEHGNFRLWGGQIHPFHQTIGHQQYVRLADNKQWVFPEYTILDGPSWLMRWETWDKYGPFDRTTAPGVCQSEEYPFCRRLTVPEHYKEKGGHPYFAMLVGGGRIGVLHPNVVIHTGLTHADGSDCVGRKEREAMIPPGVIAE